MQCEDVAELLSDAADGSVMLDRTARRHVDRCLRCQPEPVGERIITASEAWRPPGAGRVRDTSCHTGTAARNSAIK